VVQDQGKVYGTFSKDREVEEAVMKNRNWFEVSKEGLKQLQAGKSKDFVLRELVQNAWDEDGVTYCHVKANHYNNTAHISVEDDAPEGFKDITHSFMLFAPTYKRKDPERRGRFNIGEKQVLAVCQKANISTTKGTIDFTPEGRIHRRIKREQGSCISLTLRMNQKEFVEMLDSTECYLPPENIRFQVNDKIIKHVKPYKEVEAFLPTEILMAERTVYTTRKTKIHIHKASTQSYLYEMGLPICKTDCLYPVDIQQKVPLSIDRERVSKSYLQKIFTIILNEVHEEVIDDNVSDVWVREATSNKDVSDEAICSIVKSRYGSKVVSATPGDRHSVDEALSHGYRVIHGSELSKKEWDNIRRAQAVQSSSIAFPSSIATDAKTVDRDDNMDKVAVLAKKIAKRCLGIEVRVAFSSWSGVAAQYGNRTIVFNVKKLGRRFFAPPLSGRVIDLILHELAHEKGFHTEASYHSCLTKMAGELVMIALEEPEFFRKEDE